MPYPSAKHKDESSRLTCIHEQAYACSCMHKTSEGRLMKRMSQTFRLNKRFAEHCWGRLSRPLLTALQSLTSTYGLSVGRGDVICLHGRWYVTHSGLLGLASRRRCAGIQVEPVQAFCDPANDRWAFKATVFRSGNC